MTLSRPDASSYRLRVDFDLCQGHGVCVNEAPDVFALERNEAGEDMLIVRSDSPEEVHRMAVERAVRHCPTQALHLENKNESEPEAETEHQKETK